MPVDVSCHLLSVPVRFRIARARILYSHHLLVRLTLNGAVGTGEGVLYRARPHEASKLLRSAVLPRMAAAEADLDPARWRDAIGDWAAISSGLACAVDGALWDLRGKIHGKPVAELLGPVRRARLEVTEQLFIVDSAALEAALATILSRGTRHIKVKIGREPGADLEAVRRVRALAGPEVELRIDANCAYRLSEGLPLYHQLAELGVAGFEEPLARGNWSELRELRRRLGVPVILDESILSLADLQAALAAEALDALNLKLARVGGISLALAYVELCRRHGKQVMVGSSEELGVGTAEIVHLAATLEAESEVEGLGPLRLGFDVADPPWRLDRGGLAVPRGPGLGVALRAGWKQEVAGRARLFDLASPSGLWLYSQAALLRQRAENLRLRLARSLG